MVTHEVRLEKLLGSESTLKLMRHAEVSGKLIEAKFVPGRASDYVSINVGGRIELSSSNGNLLDHIPGVDGATGGSFISIRPTAPRCAHLIQLCTVAKYVHGPNIRTRSLTTAQLPKMGRSWDSTRDARG
jgi:hypothetical protein